MNKFEKLAGNGRSEEEGVVVVVRIRAERETNPSIPRIYPYIRKRNFELLFYIFLFSPFSSLVIISQAPELFGTSGLIARPLERE